MTTILTSAEVYANNADAFICADRDKKYYRSRTESTVRYSNEKLARKIRARVERVYKICVCIFKYVKYFKLKTPPGVKSR